MQWVNLNFGQQTHVEALLFYNLKIIRSSFKDSCVDSPIHFSLLKPTKSRPSPISYYESQLLHELQCDAVAILMLSYIYNSTLHPRRITHAIAQIIASQGRTLHTAVAIGLGWHFADLCDHVLLQACSTSVWHGSQAHSCSLPVAVTEMNKTKQLLNTEVSTVQWHDHIVNSFTCTQVCEK